MRFLVKWWPLIAPALLGWLGFLLSLWRIFVMQSQLKTAREQRDIAQKQLTLNVNKATPHIASRVDYRRYSIEGRPDVVRYAIYTEIFNDGDLVARKVEGKWILTASPGLKSGDKIIRVQSLSSSPTWEHKHDVGGHVMWMRNNPTATIQLDIDLVYSAIDDDQKTYRATYRYDHKQNMLLVKESQNDQDDSN